MWENGYAESSFSVCKNERNITVRIAKDCVHHWILGIQLLLYEKSDSVILHDTTASNKIRLCVKNGGYILSLADVNLQITQNDLEALESLLLDYLMNRYFEGMHLDWECTEKGTNIRYDVTVSVDLPC